MLPAVMQPGMWQTKVITNQQPVLGHSMRIP